MSFAFVLLKCEPGYEDVIVDELRSLPEVACAHKILGGPYDIIARQERQ
jgi:hypothetical protein